MDGINVQWSNAMLCLKKASRTKFLATKSVGKDEIDMTIPDTLEGATALSIIDFILSFVFIWGIGMILYLFPHLNRLGEIKEEK